MTTLIYTLSFIEQSFQFQGHKRKSAGLSAAAAEDSSEKPEAKRQKMQDENEENKKENENVAA